MQILNLKQGTLEWLAARMTYDTASEAPAMMGVSPYMTRNELLATKYTGVQKEVDAATQRIFDQGHESEAAIRPVIEAEVGEDLFPCMVAEGALSASLDGMTMDRSIIWEHKQTNKSKIAHMQKTGLPPETDFYQVQHQLMVTGAEKCLYTCGNHEDELEQVWVKPDPESFKLLKAGWKQFRADLAEFKPAIAAPEAVANTMERLPALRIEVTGSVSASNLAEYKTHALEVFNGINTDLQTDQDFADAESTVKWCKSVEDKLEAAKENALSQTASIDELFRTIDELKESARQKRLELDKLVKFRKNAVREEIVKGAWARLSEHINSLNERLGGRVTMPKWNTDFAGAIKGKRTIQSLHDAVDQVLADTKIETSALADSIQANLKSFDEIAADYKTLFPHLNELALKSNDDFVAAVKVAIAEHKEAEQNRIEQAKPAQEATELPPEPKQATAQPKCNEYKRTAHEQWWHNTGSGIRPYPADDFESHAYRVSQAAFEAGVNSTRSES